MPLCDSASPPSSAAAGEKVGVCALGAGRTASSALYRALPYVRAYGEPAAASLSRTSATVGFHCSLGVCSESGGAVPACITLAIAMPHATRSEHPSSPIALRAAATTL